CHGRYTWTSNGKVRVPERTGRSCKYHFLLHRADHSSFQHFDRLFSCEWRRLHWSIVYRRICSRFVDWLIAYADGHDFHQETPVAYRGCNFLERTGGKNCKGLDRESVV